MTSSGPARCCRCAPTARCGCGCRLTARAQAFCGNSVNIDWWWAGDAALADGFGETFDKLGVNAGFQAVLSLGETLDIFR